MQSSNAHPEHGEVEAPGMDVRKGDGYRAERTIWVVLLLMPLLVYCVVAVLTFSIKPTPITTGDPLYDKYLAWVADDLVDNAGFGVGGFLVSRTGSLEELGKRDPLAGWEAEYGDDPRYWIMRYRYSKNAVGGDMGYRPMVFDHLITAREVGAKGGAGSLILLWASENIVNYSFRYTSPSRFDNAESVAAKLLEKRTYFDAEIGDEHNLRLAELLEVAGEESLPHYYAALYDAERGDYDAAFAHLVDGNNAPGNSSLRGFPFEDTVDMMEAGTILPDKLISGAVLQHQMRLGMPNFTNFKHMLKVLVADALANNDMARMDVLHKFSCRIGYMTGNSGDSVLISLVFVGIVKDEFALANAATLSQKQTMELGNLASLRAQVRTSVRNNRRMGRMFNPQSMPLLPKTVWMVEDVLSGGKSSTVQYHELLHDENVQFLGTLGLVNQMILQMESFNYNTLEFE